MFVYSFKTAPTGILIRNSQIIGSFVIINGTIQFLGPGQPDQNKNSSW